MKANLTMIALLIICGGLSGCFQKQAYVSSAWGFPIYNRTPLMINAQAKASVLRLYQLRLNHRSITASR